MGHATDLDAAVDRARAIIQQFRTLSVRPMLAYSGGKDAIVACHIAREFGLTTGACEISFSFARQEQSIHELAEHLRLNVTYVALRGMDWLRANQHIIFTPYPKVRAWRCAERQQKSMRVFAARHGYDGILFGRRSQENTVKAPIYKTNDGRWYCHPLRDWTKVQIWEYFKVHSIPIPWIYSTHFGKHEGNAPFYSMRPEHNGGYDKCWELSEVLDPRYHRGMLQ